jgi:hypothetical protein
MTRVVELFARDLPIQERPTNEIADVKGRIQLTAAKSLHLDPAPRWIEGLTRDSR